ncbi:MAG: OmpA family protein [Dokdonella sp.]|uniref:OmpA family protein n=1 Tax=Dokdonella sp. TaxID=2291710 RepID=UPI0032676F5B
MMQTTTNPHGKQRIGWKGRLCGLSGRACIAVALTAPATAAPITIADHALVGRYEGSDLVGHTHSDFDESTLVNGPIAGTASGSDKRGWLSVDGVQDLYYYKLPAGRSTLEALRNYEASLTSKGFAIPFTCSTSNGSCYAKRPGHVDTTGPYDFANALDASPELPRLEGDYIRNYFGTNARYLLGKLARPQGAVYASIAFAEGTHGNFAFVRVVETKDMDSGKIAFVGAEQMQTALADTGRVSLYGIHFDFDKDVVTGESRPTLDEIAKVLRAQPELRLGVVGHTDAKGGADYNADLSSRRAANVVMALTRDYAIDASRLAPRGAGASEPLASNDTEEGRAKNRRVELVRR